LKVSPFTYFWYYLRYPKNRVFINEGFGIEARFKTGVWEEHLNKTKLLIADFLRTLGGVESILVLGAGRLYDCDLEILSQFTKKIILLDADPRARASWPRFVNSVPVDAICSDVTGVFNVWAENIRKNVNEFSFPSEPTYPKADLIISLNLKSQLSVLFRELVGRSIPELEAKLQAKHASDVFKQARRGALLIYDEKYEYLSDGVSVERGSLDLSPIVIPSGWKEILNRKWDWELEKGKIAHHVVGRGLVSLNN